MICILGTIRNHQLLPPTPNLLERTLAALRSCPTSTLAIPFLFGPEISNNKGWPSSLAPGFPQVKRVGVRLRRSNCRDRIRLQHPVALLRMDIRRDSVFLSLHGS